MRSAIGLALREAVDELVVRQLLQPPRLEPSRHA